MFDFITLIFVAAFISLGVSVITAGIFYSIVEKPDWKDNRYFLVILFLSYSLVVVFMLSHPMYSNYSKFSIVTASYIGHFIFQYALVRFGKEAIDLAGNKTRKEIDVIVEAKVASC
jgi:hypothetical protein